VLLHIQLMSLCLNFAYAFFGGKSLQSNARLRFEVRD
jgi:hypothetical protein